MTTWGTVARGLAIGAVAAMMGCAVEGEPGDAACAHGKCDLEDVPDSQVPATPCDGVLVDKSGRGLKRVAGRLNDPLADLVLTPGPGCPTTYAAILERLLAADERGCADVGGLFSRAVSETAQLLERPTDYRLVTNKECSGRDKHGILFSLSGIEAGAARLPDNVEIMAFDETGGVFNYYEAHGDGTISFFGNSKDMLAGSPDGETRRCAGCHVAGGLIMKELDSPWLHWESTSLRTPGAKELVDAHAPLLGTITDGIDMELIARVGNSTWNAERLEHLREVGTTADLLRPLFCTVEVNLGSMTSSRTLTQLTWDPFFDRFVPVRKLMPVDDAQYRDLLVANGQTVPGVPGEHRDTFLPLAFVERSQIDFDYVLKLIDAGILDEELVADVVMVDFTRALFSDDRCDLLAFAPSLAGAKLTAGAIHSGLIEALERAEPAAGTPAAELLANLRTPDTADTRNATVAAFTAACEARNRQTVSIQVGSKTKAISAFLVDAMQVISLNRRIARDLEVFEFPATMPEDQLDVPAGTRLHPVSCELTTEFVGVAR
jgi:hypothetical protein